MRLYPLDPLSMLAALSGMTRPLARNDFDGGHVPAQFGRFQPNPGQMRQLNWGGRDYNPYNGINSNLNLLAGSAGAGADMWNTNLVTTKQLHPLGTLAISKDGRLFRYASAGATDTVVGSIYQSAAPVANHLALTAVAEAIGAGTQLDPITVTPGATAGAANLYAEGTLCIDTAPGNGYNYRISGHPAITASTAFNLYLDPDDLIQVALTSSSRYGLHHNPYKTVIVAATTVTAIAVGGANNIITGNGTAENFGWLQTRGPFACLINGTPGVGIGVVTSATTAGAVDVAAVAAEINVRIIGRMMQVGVSTKNNSVYLQLD